MRKSSLVAVFVGLSFFAVRAQETNHYVVVGAFGVKDNAVSLSSKIGKTGLKARQTINTAKNLHYVYVFESTSLEQAYAYLMRVRVETPYKDAWIYHGQSRTASVVAAPPPKQEVKKEEPAPPPVVEIEKPVVVQEKPVEIAPVVKADPVPAKPPGKPFLFKLVSEQTGNELTGEVHILDGPKATEYIAYESNKVVYLTAPKNKSGTYEVRTLAPGYRPLRRSISYTDPANSASAVGPSEEFIIALPVLRVRQGDYIEFTGVRFYPNSAVLQPESKGELGGLASLMNENAAYKIVVHGHCNGEEARDISSPAPNADVFTTGPTNIKETADAKKLTLLRAESVKNYLVQQGVDAERIKTKGEGGKGMIYPPNSTLSARNDRVEIEIKKGR